MNISIYHKHLPTRLRVKRVSFPTYSVQREIIIYDKKICIVIIDGISNSASVWKHKRVNTRCQRIRWYRSVASASPRVGDTRLTRSIGARKRRAICLARRKIRPPIRGGSSLRHDGARCDALVALWKSAGIVTPGMRDTWIKHVIHRLARAAPVAHANHLSRRESERTSERVRAAGFRAFSVNEPVNVHAQHARIVWAGRRAACAGVCGARIAYREYQRVSASTCALIRARVGDYFARNFAIGIPYATQPLRPFVFFCRLKAVRSYRQKSRYQ